MTADDSDARLSGDDAGPPPRPRAVDAYLLIAQSDDIEINTRLSAAQRLVALDQQVGIGAYQLIARSGNVLSVLVQIANTLASLDSKAAAEVLTEALATELALIKSSGVPDDVQRVSSLFGAANRLSQLDLEAGIDVYYQLATLPFASNYRLAAADNIARLESQP